MAESTSGSGQAKLNLRCYSESSERGINFWNTSMMEMKFSVERDWVKSVRVAENKPNYGRPARRNCWKQT